jgi:hypothetical protein
MRRMVTAFGLLLLGFVPHELAAQEREAPRPEVAPAIDPDLFGGIEDRAPIRNANENPDEARAYSYFLVQTRKRSADAFARAAKRDVTFAHLWEQPADYRGQVIHVEGRLKRLRRFDAPRVAAAEAVPVVYEAWVFAEEYFSNPYCLLVTELPAGLEPAEALEVRVAFDGYFFKRYRYKAGDGVREAPLLIGRTLTLREPVSVSTGAPLGRQFLWGVAGFGVAVVGVLVGISVWLRRGDRSVRQRLAGVRAADFVEPAAEDGDTSR